MVLKTYIHEALTLINCSFLHCTEITFFYGIFTEFLRFAFTITVQGNRNRKLVSLVPTVVLYVSIVSNVSISEKGLVVGDTDMR